MSFCHQPNQYEVSPDSTPGYLSSCLLWSLWHYALSKIRNFIACLSVTLACEANSAFIGCLIAQPSDEDCTRFLMKPKLRSTRWANSLSMKFNRPLIALKLVPSMAACIKQLAPVGINVIEKLAVFLPNCATSIVNQPGSRAAIAAGYKVIGLCCKGLSFPLLCRYGLLGVATMKENLQLLRLLSKSEVFRPPRYYLAIRPSAALTWFKAMERREASC